MIKYISNNKKLLDKLKELENKDNKINKFDFNMFGDMRNLTKEEQNSLYKGLDDISKDTGINLFDFIDEIPIERRSYGCENGCCCFICVGKENCRNWFIK